MAILIVYCLKDLDWTGYPGGLRELAGIAVV
jgi:branched-subunit amino acid transport protein AzlD